MSEESGKPPGDDSDHAPEVVGLPTWVPALLGLVLVAMAGLAVYTGLTYRAKPLVRGLVKRASQITHREGPAEEQAGGSRVMPGTSGDPRGNEPSGGAQSKGVITGTGNSIESAIRLPAKRGVVLRVVPEDAIFYVNDQLMGPVKPYSTNLEAYEFPEEGSFVIRVSAEGYADQLFEVVVAPDSKVELARIETKLLRR
ncbi:MAG TPA: hypothetical protein VNM92_16965 [Thermoanaerobaculia bacterium]|nr:hypothetical protein [Thermoanaerobaculia bacterium]